MLKELLKEANVCMAELKEKKAMLEKVELDLLSARTSLDELNVRDSERLNEGYSMKVHSVHENIRQLTEKQHYLAQSIADAEQKFAIAKENALGYIRAYNISRADVAEAEDDIMFDQLIAQDENRILSQLFTAQETLYKSQAHVDSCRVKVTDAERDEDVMRVQTGYYSARKNLNDFNARMSTSTEAQRSILARQGYALEERTRHAKDEYEKLLSEYGVLHLFSELELSEADYAEAKIAYEKVKSESNYIPLTTPLSPFEKGKGVITLELNKSYENTAPSAGIIAKSHAQSGYSAETRNTEAVRELDHIDREAERRRRASLEEKVRLSRQLKSVQQEIAMLKREAEKAKADVNEIKRAKIIAALNVKRSLMAANRSATAAEAAERELVKNKLSNLEQMQKNNGNDRK